MDNNAIFKLSYGLFVLTAKNGKDNGCIVNTVQQVTSQPMRLTVAVNKANLTHDFIAETGLFNVNVISQAAPFSLFTRFGFQSGRSADKFAGFESVRRTENGLLCVTEGVNAALSAKVVETLDLGTHTLFLADVTDAETLSAVPSATYQYYFDNIKPKPQAPVAKTVWRCKICGYEYVGEQLPADFVCPICKHPASDFEKVSG